jgi:hypothetical protein
MGWSLLKSKTLTPHSFSSTRRRNERLFSQDSKE